MGLPELVGIGSKFGQGSGVFISGTDTGVGKTIVSSLIVRAVSNASYFKPIQTGLDSDTETVKRFSGKSHFPEPVYFFPEPMSPNRAAALHGVQIDLDRIAKAFEDLPNHYWVVEGCGGLMVPLSDKAFIRDLVKVLNLELLLVASTRLGTINHTLLSVEAAKNAGIPLKGLCLVGPEDPGLVELLEKFSGASVIAQIPWMESL